MAVKSTLKFSSTDNSHFNGLLKNGDVLKTLPSMHKQDWYTAKLTLEDRKINPSPCPVFLGHSLVYYFYGKPSYFVANNIGARGDNIYYPVCYIIDTECIEIEKVFPFDSGAFAFDLFTGFIHKLMDINEFSIKPHISQIKAFIKTFYDTNENYYRGFPKCDINTLSNDEIVSSYINIINNKGEENFDERCSSIEIISKHSLDLNASLEAIVVPNDFAVSNENINHLKNNGVKVITYDTFGGSPGSYNAVVRQLVYDYLFK